MSYNMGDYWLDLQQFRMSQLSGASMVVCDLSHKPMHAKVGRHVSALFGVRANESSDGPRWICSTFVRSTLRRSTPRAPTCARALVSEWERQHIGGMRYE